MAKYPVKMLKDEQNQPFVPLVSAESIYTNDDLSFEEKFATKLEADNLKEGNGIILEQNGNDTTISVDFGATDNIIDNLNTTVAGQGPLDARQGNVLKNMIPTIVDNLDSTDATKVLSANQGHELKEMSVPTGGATGQVLKKASDNDHELEWGDAADPNAIVGDGSIMKIIELTYAEYKTLESNGGLKEDTEYHITDVENGTASYKTEAQIQDMIKENVVNSLTSTSTINALSAAQGGVLNQKIDAIANYTSEEQEIGTWFGEPVYRTVYYRTGMSDKYNVTLELPANRDIVINYYGTVTLSSGYVFSIPGIGVGWDKTTEFHISDIISSYIIPKGSEWAPNCLFVASSRGRDGVEESMMAQVVAVVEYTKTK